VESSVTMKLEKKIAGVKGIKELRSTSAEGISMIIIEFLPDVVIDDALQYVRARVELAKPDLPLDADEPSIREINIAEFPIMLVNLSGDISGVRMKAIADDMQDAIEAIPGVLSAEISGALEREIRLEIDPDRAAAYNLTIPELLALIPSENVNISAGALETEGTKFFVRLPAEFVQPEEVQTLLLTVKDGKPIFLSDVATVKDTFKDPSTFSRIDGCPSITLSIQKRVGANVLEIADQVKRICAEARLTAPKGMKFEITDDRSKDIKDMVMDLENNIISGLILVVLVLFAFMGLRNSLIASVAIPLSMMMSFFILSAMGYTLNMIVLFSLILVLGMLVDDAIVIVENIYRHRQLGYNRVQAAMLGTREVAWPVITSTFTTVAAFFPLIFWPGIMGSFMKYLPITLMITLLCSLFVAMVINPTVTAVVGPKPKPRDEQHWFRRRYRALLRSAIEHRVFTVYLAGLTLVTVIVLYAAFGRGLEFFPEMDPNRAVVNIRSAQGTNVHESDRLARIVEERIQKYDTDIEHVITNVGSEGGGDVGSFLSGGGGAGPHIANVTLVFPDYAVRKRPAAEVIAALRKDLVDMPGAEIKVDKEKEGPPTGAAVTVRFIGRDFQVLDELSARAKGLIASVPGLVNLRSDFEASRPELVFIVDRSRAAVQGVDSATIGNYLKMAIFGRKVGTFREYNDEYDITLRLPLARRVNIDDLLRLRVPNSKGEAIPLSSLGRFDYRGGFGTINRIGQKRVVTLSGDAEGRLGPEVLKDAQAALKKLALPPGYEIRYAGENEEMEKAISFLSKAFLIACMLIVLILVAEFNSLGVPLIIMSTVILATAGALIGLLGCRLPFDVIMSGLGVISLAGVVVKNAIVLLDYTRLLQRRGMDVVTASVEAGETRLRPVLLTATTAVLGLIPMALGVSYDFHVFEWATKSHSSQWWQNMSIVVIFGLTFATVLTLVVVPSLYVILYKFTTERLGLGGIKPEKEAMPAPPEKEG